MRTPVVRERLDRIGSCFASACAVHCLMMPLLITAIPLGVLAFLSGEMIERILVLGSLVLASASFCWGYRTHCRSRTLLILAAAAILLLLVRPSTDEAWEPIVAALGAFGLATGHWLNLRLCRACAECEKKKW